MKLIVGLGNPGKKYMRTRHNIGFSVIECLSERWTIPVTKVRWESLTGEGFYAKEKIILMQPSTYMNLSGSAISSALRWLKIEANDLLIIYDDLDLPVGKIRLRLNGGAGGHNGIKSIILNMGHEEFKRIKIGIGRPSGHIDCADYVLAPFQPQERDVMAKAVLDASDAVEIWLKNNFEEAMNEFN